MSYIICQKFDYGGISCILFCLTMEEGDAKDRARYFIDNRDEILLKKSGLDADLQKIDEQLMKIFSGE